MLQDLAGGEISLSSLLTDKSDNLFVYSFMYSPGGSAYPACNSLLHFLNGGTLHITANLNFAVLAKATSEELNSWADSRDWGNTTLLTSTNDSHKADYYAEGPEGSQWPMRNVFRKTADGIHHTWASGLFFGASEEGLHPRHAY